MARKKIDNPRTERIEIRFRPVEKQVLEMAAEQVGLSISEFLRYVILQYASAIVAGGDSGDTEAYRKAVVNTTGRLMPNVFLDYVLIASPSADVPFEITDPNDQDQDEDET